MLVDVIVWCCWADIAWLGLQVHVPALLAAADRPPGELLAELSKLAAAREVGLDLGKQGALVWRLERQPQHWEALVDQLHLRLDQVRHLKLVVVAGGRAPGGRGSTVSTTVEVGWLKLHPSADWQPIVVCCTGDSEPSCVQTADLFMV